MTLPPCTTKLRLFRRLCAFRRDERGASAIEFAMISSFLLLLLVFVSDYALIMYRKMELTDAVRTGTQYALVNTTTATATLVEAAVTGSTNLSGVTVTVDTDLCGCSDGTTFSCASSTTCGAGTTGRIHYYTDITASYTYTWIFPSYSSGTTKTITAHSTVRTQ